MRTKSILIVIVWLMAISWGDVNTSATTHNMAENKELEMRYLLPTEELKDSYNVYKVGGNYEFFDELVENSFIQTDLKLYEVAKRYTTQLSSRINVIFKENSGCYGGIGFYLKHENGSYEWMNEPYVELDLGYQNAPEQIIPIFCHELGHVITSPLLPTEDNSFISATQIHGATVLTDYETAFHEGFGEHFEVIARDYETNPEIMERNERDLKLIGQKSKVMKKVKRDFILPLRLNYYRALSPFLISPFDTYKRITWVTEHKVCYEIEPKEFFNREKTMLYRNMGLETSNQLNTLARNLSTESVVASFFRELIALDHGTIEEKYSRIFNAMATQITDSNTSKLEAFVSEYIEIYPESKEIVSKAYKMSTGYDYERVNIPEIWCVNLKGGSITVFDQYNQLPSPVTTFNLNTCYKEDLMEIGIPGKEAKIILDERSRKGCFMDLIEIQELEGVSTKTYAILEKAHKEASSEVVQSAYNRYGMDLMRQLNVTTILKNNVIHLFYSANIMFILILVIQIFLLHGFKLLPQNHILFGTKLYIKWFVFVLLGLISSFISSVMVIHNTMVPALGVFFLGSLIIESIRIVFLRKKSAELRRHLLSSGIIIMAIVYSIL